MLAVNYSTVRNKLKHYCDMVTDEFETVLITRKKDKNVLLISLTQYNALTKAARNATADRQQAAEQPAKNRGAAQEPGEAEKARVVVDYQTAKRIAANYAKNVKRALPVDKAILFGSYAKGTATEASDINICFFLNDFAGKSHADIIGELLRLCRAYTGVIFEPIVFLSADMERDNQFVKEILATGIEL